ncbi:hypothetical protein FisN_25Hh046 [Fistulifera solaris]|uniref:Aspartyl/asparaginy/proline hydroxylase domain-containing protein n=1 Tax=Fistulifera solaris TaxID=1519565 RepID=A0A1Z5JWG1_FISSO|nr:hypothetical protein FisN_25Hh046 [Fistulifera solaris]|eukprot:GAX18071.1 hypothetical protein FisN_25Hh046 [Fistulifera solaris]
MSTLVTAFCAFLLLCNSNTGAFSVLSSKNHSRRLNLSLLKASSGKGFGAPKANQTPKKEKQRNEKNKKKKAPSTNKPYVKSETDAWLAELQEQANQSILGQAVQGTDDPFWQLIPSLLKSKFSVNDKELVRIAGFLRHAVNPDLPKLEEPLDPFRPVHQLHAYMPGLGPGQPFYEPSQVALCQQLTKHYDTIVQEYHALLEDSADRFQSVTSMNYESGWKTLVLFYNGHRIPNFPYHLCPTTTRLLETVPLAGRIAGFNRQQPNSGIPNHTDGNNMWLTAQMGIELAPESAWIQVADQKRYYEKGKCLLYDTTYRHETFNAHETQERVVLHVDFFNTITMTPIEIKMMQYIYTLREEFMKAEGVAKVGAQIL